MERLSWAIVIGFHLVWGLASLVYFRLVFILGAYSFKGLKGEPCMFIRDPLLGRLYTSTFVFLVPWDSWMSAVIFSFLAAAFCLLSWQLASHVQREVGNHLNETLYRRYPFASLQLTFPSDHNPSNHRDFALCTSESITNSWLLIFLASMFHEVNWKTPWGGKIGNQFRVHFLSVFLLSAFWPFGTERYLDSTWEFPGRVFKQTAGNQRMQVKVGVKIWIF